MPLSTSLAVTLVGAVAVALFAAGSAEGPAQGRLQRAPRSVQARPANCDPTYACQYTYTDLSSSKRYVYDFSDGCSSTDYVLTDANQNSYNFNICGNAKQNCLPASWKNVYEFGVAVQSWGGVPSCSPPGCTDPMTGDAVCCTRDCQVLGTGEPFWALEDPSNPETGGVMARFKGAAASDSDPFWCDFNPKTGAQYEREVTMHFMCDPSAPAPVPALVQPNKTRSCKYELYIRWSAACAVPPPNPHNSCVHGTMSGGACLCQPGWTGGACNTTAAVCAADERCTVCPKCCHNYYGEGTCEACVAAECHK